MRKPERLRVASYVEENDVYLFGAMGVGKTTFVESLREVADIDYISIGEMTRAAIADGDPHVSALIRKGGKLPLDAVKNMVTPRINGDSSYVLDGVPRHPDEAEWIKAHALRRPVGAVALTLVANEEIVMSRIQRRAEDGKRQETAERVSARLQVYKENNKTVLGILEPVLRDIIEINTSGQSPSEVLDEFSRRV